MKVLYSNPPAWLSQDANGQYTAMVRAGSRWPFSLPVRSQPDRFVFGDYTPFPFFLASAASYCRANVPEAEVLFRDSIATRESYYCFFDHVDQERYDYLVLESATPSWEHDASIIRRLGAWRYGPKVIVTGPIAASRGPEILAAHPNVIACIKGEYEKGVVRVLRGKCGVIDHDLLTVEEMNAAPPPWLDAQHAHLYCDTNPRGQRFPHLQAWSSRGCWAKCCFCSWPAVMTGNDPDGTGKRTVRNYTPEHMLPYLTETVASHGYRSVYFDDDLFNTSDRHVLEMCGVMRQVGLPWSSMCRADTILASTWQAMRDSGCFGVKIGMESGSQRVLDDIVNKRLDLGEALETLHLLRSLGMTVHTTWTIGLPGETQDEQRQTVELIQRLYREGLHTTHQLSGAAAIEGTPLHAIGTGKMLPKYPGAKSEGFDMDPDGMSKLGRMARR